MVQAALIRRCVILGVFAVFLAGCLPMARTPLERLEIEPLQSWDGELPVAALELLPAGQRDTRAGYLGDEVVFTQIWRRFSPDVPVPSVDFKQNLVVFSRNVRFYNRTRILMVVLEGGEAEVVAMETMSALPVQTKVAMALAVIPRQGVRSIRAGEVTIPVAD